MGKNRSQLQLSAAKWVSTAAKCCYIFAVIKEVSNVLGANTVRELAMIPLPTIAAHFPEQAQFLYDIAQGKCVEEVKERIEPKSIGCGKNFRHQLSFLTSDKDTLTKWLEELSMDLIERLELDHQDYNRCPQKINLSMRFSTTTRFAGSTGAVSRTAAIPSSNEQYLPLLLKLANDMIQSSVGPNHTNIVNISMNANTFVSMGSNNIRDAFQKAIDASTSDQTSDTTNQKSPKRLHTFSPVIIPPKKKPSTLDIRDAFQNSKCVIKTPNSKTKDITHLTSQIASPEKKSKSSSMDIRNAFQNTKGATNRPKLDDTIDLNVLAELPEDIRNEILGNRNVKPVTPKKKGIESFFTRKG